MPHLTSDALRDDPEGLAFLRAVLSPAEPGEALASPPPTPPLAPKVIEVEIVREAALTGQVTPLAAQTR